VNIHEDFEDFLRLLADRKVEFVIVGGYAVAFHGYVRTTQDLDIFFRESEKNSRNVLAAFNDFGLPVNEQIFNELRVPGNIIRMGFPPVRIEMMNTISGLSFADVWDNRVPGKYGKVNINYISYRDLLTNKKASGRPKDIADFDELGGNRGAR
jgi:hypothetical protein